MALNRDAIMAAQDLPRESVEVPEWGGSVTIRALPAIEWDAFEASTGLGETRNLANIRARLVGLCLIDDDGKRLFKTDAEIVELGKKSARVLSRLFDRCKAINAVTDEAMDELEGNSESGPEESSSST